MMIKKILLLLFISLSVVCYGQSNNKKKIAKIKEQRAQETLVKYHDAVDKQHDIQDRKTRKRMKDSLKKAKNRKPMKIRKRKK